MKELETSLHLYKPSLYADEKNRWHRSFADAVNDCSTKLTWDPAAILSILSFNYPCGDRTLLNEVKRSPWLSKIGLDGQPHLEIIPPHDRLWRDPSEIAETLQNLLCEEAVKVCQGRKEIYLLLSGGLDSRIIAGVLAKVFKEGQIETKPIAVTWGVKDCRDVFYGRAVADILGFEWKHINMSPETIIQNIEQGSNIVGCLVSPIHLHCMQWFKSVSKDALVLAASYGDSVGRAEFASKHVLELDYLQPTNIFGLIKKEILDFAYQGVKSDLKALHDRYPGAPKYVQCEHEMQCHYMRGIIAHAMTIINQYCNIYQMFTDPKVYGYMWLIHPVRRDDEIYAELLEQLEPRLVHLPWARTNKALRGQTKGACTGLGRDFHDYVEWIKGPVYEELNSYIDPDWFAHTGIFDPDRIKDLVSRINKGGYSLRLYNIRPYEIWAWLVAFRKFSEWLNKLGKRIQLDEHCFSGSAASQCCVPQNRHSKIRRLLRHSKVLYAINKRIRRFIFKRQALRKYPPQKTAVPT